jgi:hypothetical protein
MEMMKLQSRPAALPATSNLCALPLSFRSRDGCAEPTISCCLACSHADAHTEGTASAQASLQDRHQSEGTAARVLIITEATKQGQSDCVQIVLVKTRKQLKQPTKHKIATKLNSWSPTELPFRVNSGIAEWL